MLSAAGPLLGLDPRPTAQALFAVWAAVTVAEGYSGFDNLGKIAKAIVGPRKKDDLSIELAEWLRPWFRAAQPGRAILSKVHVSGNENVDLE
jgi:hypothetical protein